MKDEHSFNPCSADRVLLTRLMTVLSDIVVANGAEDDVGMGMAISEAAALLEEAGW